MHDCAGSSTPCCFSLVPGTSALYSCSTAFLGSTKGAGYVGERRVPPLENYGEEVSELGRCTVLAKLLYVKGYVLVTVINIWQVY